MLCFNLGIKGMVFNDKPDMEGGDDWRTKKRERREREE